ncbi:hypothetical protein QZH41_015760, partial [Actinostola sp. cb2023]
IFKTRSSGYFEHVAHCLSCTLHCDSIVLWKPPQCGIECDGMFLSLAVKEFILIVGIWALYFRKTRFRCPRVNVLRIGVMVLVFLVLCLLLSVLHSRELCRFKELPSSYWKSTTKTSLNRTLYDGSARSFVYQTILDSKVMISTAKVMENSKVNPRTRAIITSSSQGGRRNPGRKRSLFYEEAEFERKVKRRKARLMAVCEEAFGHIRRIQLDRGPTRSPWTQRKRLSLCSRLRASATKVPTYRQTTSPGINMDAILKHLAHCLAFDMSPKAFLE